MPVLCLEEKFIYNRFSYGKLLPLNNDHVTNNLSGTALFVSLATITNTGIVCLFFTVIHTVIHTILLKWLQ